MRLELVGVLLACLFGDVAPSLCKLNASWEGADSAFFHRLVLGGVVLPLMGACKVVLPIFWLPNSTSYDALAASRALNA